MKRRNFLKTGAIIGASATLVAGARSDSISKIASSADLNVVFMSDVHIKPHPIAENGMRKALQHINNLKDKPSFILNGGDSIMDSLAATKEDTKAQWDIWSKILNEENTLPIYHCIGNHDIWGWQVKEGDIKSDPLYDKNWAMLVHQLPHRYYSFRKGHWHFIVLDSTQKNNAGYIALLDEGQYQWLEKELESVPKDIFVCIVSHIPIISFCSAMFFKDMLPNGDWKLSRALLHTDARRIKNLFKSYPHIKACLSGHIHLQDEVEYLGVKYFCNGAISGNWWNGSFQDFDPAYALFRFGDDGHVSRQMINYDL
ncbi:MAG: metallophosphoesterase [Saprospiraceae bacterium]